MTYHKHPKLHIIKSSSRFSEKLIHKLEKNISRMKLFGRSSNMEQQTPPFDDFQNNSEKCKHFISSPPF